MCSAQVPVDLPPRATSCVAFVPGSASLLLFTSPCLRATALLFSYTQGAPLREVHLSGVPTSLAVSPMGQVFALGLQGARVLLVDAALGASSELLACDGGASDLSCNARDVRSVTFLAGGRQLAAAVGGVLTVWDA
jgi:hypothetical protein